MYNTIYKNTSSIMKKTLLILLFITLPFVYSFAQEEVLTNQSIIDMVELGFSEDIIVTKLKVSSCNFDTSIDQLKKLKESGVSTDVIKTMIEVHNQVITAEQEYQDEMDNIRPIGVFYEKNEEWMRILPTVFAGTKVNTLGGVLTGGIVSDRIKSILNGRHSANDIHTNQPVFVFSLPENKMVAEKEFGISSDNWWFYTIASPNEFTLVKLRERKRQREINVGSDNVFSGTKQGLRSKDIIPFSIEIVDEFTFLVRPISPLEKGEYCFFYQGTIPDEKFSNQSVFDFSIRDSAIEYEEFD